MRIKKKIRHQFKKRGQIHDQGAWTQWQILPTQPSPTTVPAE